MPSNVGRGKSGLRGRPGLAKDIESMSDAAKRKRRKSLEKVTEGNLKNLGKRPARSVQQYETARDAIRRWQRKAAELRSKAREVERSGTGNQRAADTYRQAASEYIKKVKQLQAKQRG